jgi:tRNA threonylcarbamoyladenosine biosynthesis protein TsaE
VDASHLPQRFTTRSETETVELGERLAASLQPGATLLLHGDLGAGKTALIRGLARGLGIDPMEVSSPTFVLIQEYTGRLKLYHVDLYRVEPAAVDDLGLEELAGGSAVVVIEWAERLPRPVPGAIRLTIADRGGTVREILLEKQ